MGKKKILDNYSSRGSTTLFSLNVFQDNLQIHPYEDDKTDYELINEIEDLYDQSNNYKSIDAVNAAKFKQNYKQIRNDFYLVFHFQEYQNVQGNIYQQGYEFFLVSKKTNNMYPIWSYWSMDSAPFGNASALEDYTIISFKNNPNRYNQMYFLNGIFKHFELVEVIEDTVPVINDDSHFGYGMWNGASVIPGLGDFINLVQFIQDNGLILYNLDGPLGGDNPFYIYYNAAFGMGTQPILNNTNAPYHVRLNPYPNTAYSTFGRIPSGQSILIQFFEKIYNIEYGNTEQIQYDLPEDIYGQNESELNALTKSEQFWPFDPNLYTTYFGNVGWITPTLFKPMYESIELWQKYQAIVGRFPDAILKANINFNFTVQTNLDVVITAPKMAFGRDYTLDNPLVITDTIARNLQNYPKIQSRLQQLFTDICGFWYSDGLYKDIVVRNYNSKIFAHKLWILITKEYPITMRGNETLQSTGAWWATNGHYIFSTKSYRELSLVLPDIKSITSDRFNHADKESYQNTCNKRIDLGIVYGKERTNIIGTQLEIGSVIAGIANLINLPINSASANKWPLENQQIIEPIYWFG